MYDFCMNVIIIFVILIIIIIFIGILMNWLVEINKLSINCFKGIYSLRLGEYIFVDGNF